MVYTKGHQEDEKLHKAYHQGAVQGFKFQVCSRLAVMHSAACCMTQRNSSSSYSTCSSLGGLTAMQSVQEQPACGLSQPLAVVSL
jgi:hypothetical protein